MAEIAQRPPSLRLGQCTMAHASRARREGGAPSTAKGLRNCRRHNRFLSTSLKSASTQIAAHRSLITVIWCSAKAIASWRERRNNGAASRHSTTRLQRSLPAFIRSSRKLFADLFMFHNNDLQGKNTIAIHK